jgi:hypothetical protein
MHAEFSAIVYDDIRKFCIAESCDYQSSNVNQHSGCMRLLYHCVYVKQQNERVASVSYVWAMQACNKANKWQKAMSIWHDLLGRHNVELTEPACAAAIEVSTIAHTTIKYYATMLVLVLHGTAID